MPVDFKLLRGDISVPKSCEWWRALEIEGIGVIAFPLYGMIETKENLILRGSLEVICTVPEDFGISCYGRHRDRHIMYRFCEEVRMWVKMIEISRKIERVFAISSGFDVESVWGDESIHYLRSRGCKVYLGRNGD